MRLLFLTSRLPYPPDRGDRVRTYQILKTLAREHKTTLVSFVAHEEERGNVNKLSAHCEDIHLVHQPTWRSNIAVALNVWRDVPLQILYYRSNQMQRKIDNLLKTRSFDVAYIHLFRMAPYWGKHPEIYSILDLTDLISSELRASIPYQNAFWRSIYHLEFTRVKNFEQRVASRFDEVWFISKRDRDLYAQSAPQTRLQVIPSCIDESLFLFQRPDNQSIKLKPKLLFVGNLEVKHNIDALTYLVKEVLPLIQSEVPGCELLIAGAGNRKTANGLERYPGVRVVGFVPDLRTVYAETSVSIAPLRFSAGVQFKAIEAMAAGLPVVTTSDVSDGLGTEPGRDLLVGDSAESFAVQVVRLLQDKQLSLKLGHAGRAFVREYFTSPAAFRRLNDICTNLPAR